MNFNEFVNYSTWKSECISTQSNLYLFGNNSIGTNIHVPKMLKHPNLEIVNSQFYHGPVGSGAPMHFHVWSTNFLAYGRKKWFFLPPKDAVYSMVPWDSSRESFTCVQDRGDVIVVPDSWSHATLNLAQSTGIAYELLVKSVMPLCNA